MTNTQIKSTLKSLALAGLTALACLNAKAADIPKPYVETALVSDFVSPGGGAVRENCRQDLGVLSSKGLTFALWQNQFLGEKGISERDYCLSYSRPITSNLTANVGFQYWDYPNGRFGDHDSVEGAGINYKGKVNASLGYLHLNKTDATESGDRVHLKLSKTLPIYKGKINVSLTPSLETAYLNNYYGNSGVSQVSPGLTLSASKGNFSVNFSGKSQRALINELESFNWGSVGISYQF